MVTDQNQRPNYFELLEIDPDAPWSDSTFQIQLNRKKAEWTRGGKHPNHALRYRNYLDQVNDITAVMTNPVRRTAEQEAARVIRAQTTRETERRFQQDIDLRAAKGFLTSPEVTNLIREYTPVITEQVIRNTIEQTGVEVRPAESSEPMQQATLEPSTMKNIEANLEIVGQPDLYRFLSMTRTSRTSDLHARANALYAENQKQANKTAVVTATSDLAGQAMKVFTDDATRTRYDNALAMKAYSDLGEAVQRITQDSKTLHAAQFEKLLERARGQGLDLKLAEQYIRKRAQDLQVALYITEATNVQRQLWCASCGTLAGPDSANCPTCATPLKLPCPNCRQVMLTEYLACTHCGFPIGNLANVRAMLAEAESLYDQRHFDLAERVLQEARRQWSIAPGSSADSTLDDPLCRTLDELMEAVKADQKTVAEALRYLQQCMDERRFYAARETLREIETELPTLDVEDQRKQIMSAIKQAETELRRARVAEAKGNDVIALYQQILWECKDCAAAQDALARTPPAPPGDLTVQAGQRVARLSWQPGPVQGIHYTIVRKYGARPISPTDGDTLATVSGTTYDDMEAAIGLSTFYGVYTNREGVLSTEAALSNEPVLFTADVAALSAQVDNRLVRLRWQAPPNTAAVEVRRGEHNAPHDLDTGTRIRVFGLNDAVDSGLQNEHTYHYSVFALFESHTGEVVSSPGMSISAMPQEPPAVIDKLDIHIKRMGKKRELRIGWEAPAKGEAVLLHSSHDPDLRAGHALPHEALAEYGKLTTATRNEAVLTLEGTGIIYLTPVVLFQEMAYIGQTQAYTVLDDIHGLKAQNLGFALQLQWEWPANCRHAIVAYGLDRFVTPDDPEAVHFELTRAEYDLHGRFRIENPLEHDYFITVYAVIMQDGQRLIAPGTEPTCRQRISLGSSIMLNYSITRQRRLIVKRPLQLVIEATGAGELPDMVLVRKQTTPPLSKADGQPILRIRGRWLEEASTTLVEDIDAALERPQSYARLFLEDDSLYQAQGGHIRINNPEQERLKVY